MRIGDIVPAELQNAPDYSTSAPLFLSSLQYLSGSASYYNPTQAAQGNPLPAPGGSMTVDPTTCLMAQCGVPTDPATVAACSAAGYVGAKACTDPSCVPYQAQIPGCMPAAAAPSPAPPSSPVPMPSATAAPMPSIVKTAPLVAPMPVVTTPMLNQRMPSIVDTTPAVIAQPCGDAFAQWVNSNPLLALAGLGVLAFVVFGGRR